MLTQTNNNKKYIVEHKHKQATKHKYEQAHTCTHNIAQTQKGKAQTILQQQGTNNHTKA